MNRFRPIWLILAITLATGAAQAQLKLPLGKTGTGIKTAPAAAAATPTPAAPVVGDAPTKEAAGQLAAAAWLTLLDRGNWGQAWDGSAQMFRTSVPLGAWMDGIPKVRQPLGVLQERTPVDAVHKTVLAGKPDGDYVTASFASKFSNKPDSEEIVTTVLEADGKWRVTGYQTR